MKKFICILFTFALGVLFVNAYPDKGETDYPKTEVVSSIDVDNAVDAVDINKVDVNYNFVEKSVYPVRLTYDLHECVLARNDYNLNKPIAINYNYNLQRSYWLRYSEPILT